MTPCDLCGDNTEQGEYIDGKHLCPDCAQKYREGLADWLESRMEDR